MVDISIDQGGCFETSRPNTHADPTYVADEVVHYCVTNRPGIRPVFFMERPKAVLGPEGLCTTLAC